MGLPEISITFTRKAATLIKRSSRGRVVLLLQDESKGQIITAYEDKFEIEQSDWSEQNYEYIKMALVGTPALVIAVRVVQTDGVMDLVETVKLIKDLNYDWLACPTYTDELDADNYLTDYIQKARAEGKKVKAVFANRAADHAGVVNFAQAHISALWDWEKQVKEYTAAEYTVRLAGLLAGLSLKVSSTYYVLEEIVDIEQIVKPNEEIDAGKLIVIYDGEKYKIGSGVTSLVTTSEDSPVDFKKIKIVEGADLILTDIYSTFNDNFIGKVNNTYDNKQDFVGAVNSYFENIQGEVLNGSQLNFVEVDMAQNKAYLKKIGTDVSEMSDQELKEANTGSHLFLCGNVSMLDAMEDLSLILRMQ